MLSLRRSERVGTKAPENDANSANSADPLVQLRRLIPYLDDEELDLDAIDGEFYWRCCRRDLHIEVENLVALVYSFDRVEIEVSNEQKLEQAQAIENAIDHLVSRFEPEDPHIARHLFQTEGWTWIRLRDGRLTEYPTGPANPLGPPPSDAQEDRVELRIVSNRWTGADVEERIMAYLKDPQFGHGGWSRQHWPGTEPSTDSMVVRVAFEFAPAGSEVFDMFRRSQPPTLALPHIVVTVAPPIPPAGAIAKLYDDIVLGQHRWHERLTGSPTRQEKRVALRTWAVGLLVGSGRKTSLAIRDVSEVLGEEEISQVQFTEDRRRLVELVPEAQPYLYAKPPRRSLAQNR